MDRPKTMSRKVLERTTITLRKGIPRRFSCKGASGDWILTSSLLRDAVNEDLDGAAVVLKIFSFLPKRSAVGNKDYGKDRKLEQRMGVAEQILFRIK